MFSNYNSNTLTILFVEYYGASTLTIIISFFGDLKKVRLNTLKKSIIKHALKDSGIYLISYKASIKKIRSY